MKKSVPLFTGALLLSLTSFSQVKENFENGEAALLNNCWQLNNVKYATRSQNPDYVIHGNGGLYSEPPVNSSNFRSVATPFLDVSNHLTLSFDYQLSSPLKDGATRIIKVGLVDKNGGFTLLKETTMDHTASTKTETFSVDQAVTPGVYRLMVQMGGTLGDGTCRLLVDNLDIAADFHYAGGCNTAPVAAGDAFTTVRGNPFTDASVLTNDQDADGDQLSAMLVSNSPDGNVTLNADGTFTFVPHIDFEGSSTTFTYKVVDNGYAPATSNTATVTLNFAEPATTLMRLVSFSGRNNDRTLQLQWEVGMNELIDHFEIEQSSNGVKFTKMSQQPATTQTGNEQYNRQDRAANSDQLYRLKLVGKNGNELCSEVIKVEAPRTNTPQPITVLSNPVGSSLDFRYTATTAGRMTISVLNSNGVTAFSWQRTVQKGQNQFSFSEVGNLKPGTYVLNVVTDAGESSSTMFLKM
jgi:hypothetical protein